MIEDSEIGIIAAKKASIKCFAFRNPNSGRQDLSQADIVVNDINEINLNKIQELILGNF